VKGELLDAELVKKKPKVVVELGGYCGYSALRIARKLAANGNDGHLYSVEMSPLHAAIATKILEFAGQRSRVTVLVGTASTTLDKKLKPLGCIDLLFLDHAKDYYKSDFQLFENAGLIKPGSVVVADNCLYPGCPEYVAYIKDNKDYDSVKHETQLEYCDKPDHVWVSVRK
jgi:catechol O-methyltransferase